MFLIELLVADDHLILFHNLQPSFATLVRERVCGACKRMHLVPRDAVG